MLRQYSRAKNDQNTDTQTQSTQSSIKDNFHSVKPDKDNDEAQEKPNTDETECCPYVV